MKVLVTGATGFFGRGIVERLRRDGHAVTGAARRSGGAPDVEPLDVTDADACRALLARGRFDAVVHAAALAHVKLGKRDEAACRTVNALGTRNVAEAAEASGAGAFVFISSVMVYGDADLPVPVTEEQPRRADGPYGASKIEAEDYCNALADRMRVTVLRMASMYSPEWLFNVRKRVAPPVVGHYCYFTLDPSTARYSLCSRRNGAEVVARAVDGRLAPGVYNVADAHVYRQMDILRAVEAVEGRKAHLPVPRVLPAVAWKFVRLAVPVRAWRQNAHSRYWKFCEHNVYSSARLTAAGVDVPPDLLAIGSGAAL